MLLARVDFTEQESLLFGKEVDHGFHSPVWNQRLLTQRERQATENQCQALSRSVSSVSSVAGVGVQTRDVAN
jgi:hypothetical protein